MKLPKSFRMEKDLEKKTEQLVNYAKKKPIEPDIHLGDDITCLAAIIATQKGINAQEWVPKATHKAYIKEFSDIDYELEISYQYEIDAFDDVKEYFIRIIYKGQGVFERNHKDGIRNQISGAWEDILFKIYKDEIA